MIAIVMLLYIEHLKRFNPIVSIEADLRDDEDSMVKFSDEMDGPVLQLAGNGIEIAIALDDEHLQIIVDQLAEWGWKAP